MASILRRVGIRTDRDNSPCRFRPTSDSEASVPGELVDDRDEFTVANSSAGTLSFCEEEKEEFTQPRSSMLVPFEGGQQGTVERVVFEVTSAEKVQDSKSSFVLYTILITRNSRTNKVPSVISKRYSDFDKLNKQLKKQFPSLLEDVVFPKKKIAGNFTSETIARRSRGFEQYLAHIFSLQDVRNSPELAKFFYQEDLQTALSLVETSQTAEAIPLFEHVLPVQEKLLGDSHPKVIRTLCALVHSHSTMGNRRMAQKYAETALKCLEGQTSSKYLAPLLETSIRLCWEIGKDKQDLEARLNDLRQLGLADKIVPLEDLIQQELLV